MENVDCLCQNVLIERLIQSVYLIELWYKAEKSGQSDVWRKGYFSAADLRLRAKAGTCRDGVDFSIPSNPGKLSVRQSICCHVTF